MKISPKKYTFDAFQIFLKLENLILATFLHFDFSVEFSFPSFLEDNIFTEKSQCKKPPKLDFRASKNLQIRNASNLYFF